MSNETDWDELSDEYTEHTPRHHRRDHPPAKGDHDG